MQGGNFQNQPSLSLTKRNEGKQILKLIETKDYTNMILTILRRIVQGFLKTWIADSKRFSISLKGVGILKNHSNII